MGGSRMSGHDLAVVKRFPSLELAEVASSRLFAAGLESWVRSDDAGGMYPNLSAVRGVAVRVRAEDLEAATAILAEDASASIPVDSDDPALLQEAERSVRTQSRAPSRILLAVFLPGVLVGLLCGYLVGRIEPPGVDPRPVRSGQEVTHDDNRDGVSDSWWAYAGGRAERSRHDRNFDGRPDLWFDYRDGVPVRGEADHNFDGEVDAWSEYREGLVSHERIDTDHDGALDLVAFYEHEVLERIEWLDPDRVVRRRHVFEGGVLREVQERDSADAPFRTVIRFDAHGRHSGPP